MDLYEKWHKRKSLKKISLAKTKKIKKKKD